MDCKRVWSREYIDEMFTKVFINGSLREHREKILIEREKSLLPETQVRVVREKQRRAIQTEILQDQIRINELRREIKTIRNSIMEKNDNLYRLYNNNEQPPREERSKFIRKCPQVNCRGFLSNRWKCGTCDCKVCPDCNEIKIDENVEHVCNPDNVKTVELLKKDTKACPKCATMIHKISGCDQIWCTDCHTTFNWATGRIDTGSIHNPHFFEWLRKQSPTGEIPRDAGYNPCGDRLNLPHIFDINRQLQKFKVQKHLTTNIHEIYRTITHMNQVTIPHYDRDNYEENLIQFRVSYLLNELSEDIWMKELQNIEKTREKNRDYLNIYRMFVDVSTERFNTFYNDIRDKNMNNVNEYIEEEINIFNNLREYFNDSFEKIGKRYSCVYPGITNNFSFVTDYKKYLTEEKQLKEVQVFML
jgi:hypothetical protein